MLPGQKLPKAATPDTLPAAWRGGIAAIGNFDGVHRGHQAVLLAAREEAKRLKCPCIMLTFEPHPRAFFSGRPLFRLTPQPLKATLGAALGLDGTLVFPFDRALAGMRAEDFVRDILVERLAIRSAVTGYDFQFGRARRGTAEFLAEEGARNGFSVTIVGALEEGGSAVSATRIRSALSQGNADDAARMLGWHFAVSGEVVHGERRGRELGYPTANMQLDPASELMHGIYAVRLVGRDGVLRDGVASYGRRPTFGGGAPLLETFVFDFSGDLYGQEVLVALYGFIRPEQKFGSAAQLVARMDQDSIEARAILERRSPGALDQRLYELAGRSQKHTERS